jgi:hypothetical protein
VWLPSRDDTEQQHLFLLHLPFMAFAPCPSTLEKLQGMVAFDLFLSHAADQASVQAAHYIYIYIYIYIFPENQLSAPYAM